MSNGYTQHDSGLYIREGATTQLTERIAELEFALEDREWINLSNVANAEFSRNGLQSITRLARLMFLKNPLVARGVKVKADYIFGRSVNITAPNTDVQAVIDGFLNDERNQSEFTSQSARIQKEIELQTDGNIFFVFFVHPSSGHVRVRTIPVDQIVDIVCNPEDRKEPWYYKRQWTEETTNLDTGETKTETKTRYYPDWRYKGTARTTIGGADVDTAPIYHIKVGGFSDWKFGVSEVYAAIDWARAYKTFLENWSTVVAAYARFAHKLTTTGGKPAVQAAKTKLASTIGAGNGERNPAPAAGATFVGEAGKVDLEPMRTAGATTSPADGRRLLLMVAATFGLPETFFGDVSVGTLATARSLDRPTELGFVNRQALWADIYHDILEFVKYHAVSAPVGPLRALGNVERNEYGEIVVTFDEETDAHVDIDFPSIVEHSLTDYMAAVTAASAYIPDNREIARMVLTALGENDVDELLDKMYPPIEPGEVEIDPATLLQPVEETPVLEAVKALREALDDFREAIPRASATVDMYA